MYVLKKNMSVTMRAILQLFLIGQILFICESLYGQNFILPPLPEVTQDKEAPVPAALGLPDLPALEEEDLGFPRLESLPSAPAEETSVPPRGVLFIRNKAFYRDFLGLGARSHLDKTTHDAVTGPGEEPVSTELSPENVKIEGSLVEDLPSVPETEDKTVEPSVKKNNMEVRKESASEIKLPDMPDILDASGVSDIPDYLPGISEAATERAESERPEPQDIEDILFGDDHEEKREESVKEISVGEEKTAEEELFGESEQTTLDETFSDKNITERSVPSEIPHLAPKDSEGTGDTGNLSEKSEKIRVSETKKTDVQGNVPHGTRRKQDSYTRLEPYLRKIAPRGVNPSSLEPVPITTEVTELLARIRRTHDMYKMISLSTEENRPGEVMNYVLAFGCTSEIYYGYREENRYVNALGAICWNIPMSGRVALSEHHGKLLPRIGYGTQMYSGQLLATFALSRVPCTYRFPANREVPSTGFSVTDLIEFQMQQCREGDDMSWVLIGLAYYLKHNAQWKTGEGEIWNLERILRSELKREVNLSTSSATNRLLGLSYAVRMRKLQSAPYSEAYAATEKYLATMRQFTFSLQNHYGCWHPQIFQMKGTSTDWPGMQCAAGHIMRWVVLDTSRDQLGDVRIITALDVIERLLYYHLSHWDPATASPRDVEGIMAGLQALSLYEQRMRRGVK